MENQKNPQQYSDRLPGFIIQGQNAARKTRLFNLLFDRLPTYEELVNKSAILKPEFVLATS